MSTQFSNKKLLLLQSNTKVTKYNEFHANTDDDEQEIATFKNKTSFRNKDKTNNTNNTNISPSKSVFDKTGYKVTTKISTTLQGSVYNAINKKGNVCVVKRASAQLHYRGLAQIDGTLYECDEDIIAEANIMKYLTSLNGPKGFTRFIDFFCDGKNYFLLMEHGGESLFKHVTEFHKKIRQGLVKLEVWKKHVKILFKQMCKFVNWLHNKARLVHLDISLENMLLKGCIFKNGRFVSHGQINFIDFGLSKSYVGKKSFDGCTKYVGKQCYLAPKVYQRIPFNACKADIWCLGVVLFVMTTGALAYKEASSTDPMFCIIYGGYIEKWANNVGKSDYISPRLLDLFSRLFCQEKCRWKINKIIKHKYVK